MLIAAGGVVLAVGMVCGGALYEAKGGSRAKLYTYAKGMGVVLGAMLVALLALIAVLFFETGEYVLTVAHAREVVQGSALLPVVLAGLAASIYALIGALPGFAWQREGARELPKAQQLLMRAFLPTALLPHVLTLSAWAGADVVVRTLFLVGSIAALGALLEKIQEKEDGGEIFFALLIMLGSASGSYGVAGAIPAAMMGIVGVCVATMFTLAQGGVWLKSRVRWYASAVCVGIPVISPLFVPFMLSIGYGLQMKPIFATCIAGVSAYALFVLTGRLHSAWTEETPRYAEIWMGNIAKAFLVFLTIYGVWFLHADALGIVVNAVDSL